jgi:hypothetical protein
MTAGKPPQPDPLAQAAQRFLDALMPILKGKCPGGDDAALTVRGLPRWLLDVDLGVGGRSYKAVPIVFTAEQQCAARMLGELREAGMEPLADLVQALRADPTIGPRLSGQSVTSFGAGGHAWQAPSMIQLLVDRALTDGGGFDLEPSVRDSVTKGWVEALRRASDRLIVVVALREFEASTVPILLEPDLQIDELSEREVTAALAFGGGLRGLAIDERHVARTFGIRTSFDSRLFIDEIPAAESQREQDVRQQAEERAALLLLALRVFKAGRVSASGSFQYTMSWWDDVSPAQGSIGPLFGWHAAQPYVLADEEVTRLREFWSSFKKAHDRPTIASALRRFSFAGDRTLPEDEIVDLLIASESLFFSDISRADRGEFRFRLSTRVALLLGETADERKSIAKFMRHAYDARSGIVHGGDPGAENLRTLEGHRVSAAECAAVLMELLRRALRTAIGFEASGQGFPPNWDELMFGREDMTSG